MYLTVLYQFTYVTKICIPCFNISVWYEVLCYLKTGKNEIQAWKFSFYSEYKEMQNPSSNDGLLFNHAERHNVYPNIRDNLSTKIMAEHYVAMS